MDGVRLVRFGRRTIVAGWLPGLLACSITGPTDYSDVSVEADFRPDNVLALTVHNGSRNAIFFRAPDFCGPALEHRKDSGWEHDPQRPYGYVVFCILVARPLQRVDPSELYAKEWPERDMKRWLPGEYRFSIPLADAAKRPLPEETWHSNPFRVD